MKIVRCAIYTRKSTEEGLEQDFNSLAAQREACAAYIKSQAGEGWRLVSKSYDDGGYSGGSMDRPAVLSLLDDIVAGLVDVIVVYKVDRLTRSLLDFSKIVERLEARGASFVSVTQAFNTTTSMGRLTLNVLLSFAQFEREVTGERIRDKIAASKQKGMWMGGRPPLGYQPHGRTLAIAPDEADLVRAIFRRFVELGSTASLARALMQEGVRSKAYVSKTGKQFGDAVLSLGALRHLLSNRTYRGEIRHRDNWYPGLHPPIVDAELFEAAQQRLAKGPADRKARPSGAPLAGLLFDDAGAPMSPSYAQKRDGSRRHYYVSQALMRPACDRKAGSRPRVHAGWIERQVADGLARAFDQTMDIKGRVSRVVVSKDGVSLRLIGEVDAERVRAKLEEAERLEIDGDECWLRLAAKPIIWRGARYAYDQAGNRAFEAAIDQSLFQAIARAHGWRREWTATDGPSFTAIAKREGADLSYLLRVARLAFLAPDIVRLVVSGRSLPALTVERIARCDLPLDWSAQRRLLLEDAC